MPEIVNLQNSNNIEIEIFDLFIKNVFNVFDEIKDKDFAIAFVDDETIRQLNKDYRNKDYVTDVLSFENDTEDFENDEDYLGDIVISADQARKQASENEISFELELQQLILHGILHLCGYDHETDNGEMNDLELKLRAKLDIE